MKLPRRIKIMKIFGRPTGFASPGTGKAILVVVLSWAVLFATMPLDLTAAAYRDTPSAEAQAQAQAPQYTTQTAQQLQQMVAPIALYPDSLVAQILAASAFPEQVVEADRWVQANPNLKGDDLGRAVDKQPWDPSVKALTPFPSVLGNMDKNLTWTSSLGDAYYNQQQDVMDAIQVMRERAEKAGNLKTTPQQVVTTQGSTVVIQPADPNVVYVPAYNPWLVYGYPVVAWPGWYPYPGIWWGGRYLSFGIGFGIGWGWGWGWGWGHWGFNWRGRYVVYNNGRYFARSNAFYNRASYYRGGGARGVTTNVQRGMTASRAASAAHPFGGNTQAARGYGAPRGQSGTRSGAFSGYDHGAQARTYSSRGRTSVGGGYHGGGAPHGGGASHGGGHGH
jgi:hypothetical protein